MTETEKKEPTAVRGLKQKTAARTAAEQAILKTLELARASFWTLRQLRHGLRKERRRFHEEWGGSRKLWYVAVRTVAGCRVTEIADLRQREIGDWRTR